jgi:hypothetical protein
MLKYLNGDADDFARYAAHVSEHWESLPVAMRYIQRSMVCWRTIAALREEPSVWISLHDADIKSLDYDLLSHSCCLVCITDDNGDAMPVTLDYRNVCETQGDLNTVVGQTILYHEVDIAPGHRWTHRLELSSGSCISLTFDDVSLTIGLP